MYRYIYIEREKTWGICRSFRPFFTVDIVSHQMFCPYTLCLIIPFVRIRFVSLYLLSLYVVSHYTFCPYTFCLIRHFFCICFVRIRFVALYLLSFQTFCPYTFCLFRCLSLYLLSLYVLSFRRYGVIRSVVRRFVKEPSKTYQFAE